MDDCLNTLHWWLALPCQLPRKFPTQGYVNPLASCNRVVVTASYHVEGFEATNALKCAVDEAAPAMSDGHRIETPEPFVSHRWRRLAARRKQFDAWPAWLQTC